MLYSLSDWLTNTLLPAGVNDGVEGGCEATGAGLNPRLQETAVAALGGKWGWDAAGWARPQL